MVKKLTDVVAPAGDDETEKPSPKDGGKDDEDETADFAKLKKKKKKSTFIFDGQYLVSFWLCKTICETYLSAHWIIIHVWMRLRLWSRLDEFPINIY